MNALNPTYLVGLSPEAIAKLMPMYLLVGNTGHIRQAGPTISKLKPQEDLIGTRFLESFELRRPRNISTIEELSGLGAVSLSMRLRTGLDRPLKGLSVPLADGSGLLINIALGIGVAEVVSQFGLSSADFPPTDLAMEMLYLIEAKNAVTDEYRCLSSRLEGAKIAAEEQAFSDTLTGLKNRRAMEMILHRLTAEEQPFSLMHLDLDFFKQVNDTLGHAAGDLVLQETARVLVDETREDDAVIRFGGDEFVLIFPGLEEPEKLARVSRRILARLEQPIPYEDEFCNISGSIGLAITSDYEQADPEKMIFDADMALYASKKAGRAQYTFARELPDDAE